MNCCYYHFCDNLFRLLLRHWEATRKRRPLSCNSCPPGILIDDSAVSLEKDKSTMTVGNISENPPKNAVTRPTVAETRDQDIAGMLRLYGIGYAFSHGIIYS